MQVAFALHPVEHLEHLGLGGGGEQGDRPGQIGPFRVQFVEGRETAGVEHDGRLAQAPEFAQQQRRVVGVGVERGVRPEAHGKAARRRFGFDGDGREVDDERLERETVVEPTQSVACIGAQGGGRPKRLQFKRHCVRPGVRRGRPVARCDDEIRQEVGRTQQDLQDADGGAEPTGAKVVER